MTPTASIPDHKTIGHRATPRLDPPGATAAHVELTAKAQKRIAAIYDDLIHKDAIRRASAYTIEELRLIVRFLQDSRATYEQAMSELGQRPDAGREE